MRLRDVQLGDVEAYVRMRCDPAMMVHLGGPRPRADMADKVRRDVDEVTSGRAWICMILAGDDDPDRVAGTVALWTNDEHGTSMSEIGWMVLPEFQGRGLAKRAVSAVLERARDERRWGIVHALPSVDNAASNGICRSLGFTLLGEEEVEYAGQRFRSNHWQRDLEAQS